MFDRISRTWHRWDISRRLRRNGWTGIYVGDLETPPTWAYTIGFRSTLGAPEVIVFDLPQPYANALFWRVFEDIQSGALTLRDGERWGDAEHQACWRRVHPSRFEDDEQPWFGLSRSFDAAPGASSGEFEAFQLVLADNEGRLPWEAGYDEFLRPKQRELYLAVEAPARQVAEGVTV